MQVKKQNSIEFHYTDVLRISTNVKETIKLENRKPQLILAHEGFIADCFVQMLTLMLCKPSLNVGITLQSVK